MVEERGGLSKNVSQHGWPTTKNKRKKNTGENALKQSQKYEIWTKIYMIQILIFRVPF